MQEPNLVRKFFASVFAFLGVVLMGLLGAAILGYNDLHAGALAVGILVTWGLYGALAGKSV